MSQNIRATGASSPRQGRISNVFGSGMREHVGLLDPAVALDRRAVEGHALLEGVLELGRGDREALQLAEDVGEPEAHEAHAAFLDGPQHVVELLLHRCQCGRSRTRHFRRPEPAADALFTRRSHRGNRSEMAR